MKKILNDFIQQLHDDELKKGFFPHDGVISNTTNLTLNYLHQFFHERGISIKAASEYPHDAGYEAHEFFSF